jgi:hypothetical protein
METLVGTSSAEALNRCRLGNDRWLVHNSIEERLTAETINNICFDLFKA